MTEPPALRDSRLNGLSYEVVRTGPVGSLEEAARARGVQPSQVIKTMVVRRAADDFLFVLVPGDRVISWPKLRSHLGVSRLSMPDAEEALRVTGYSRGAITPLGSTERLPVIADARLQGQVSIGGGEHGVSLTMKASDLFTALGAATVDVTEEPSTPA